MLAAPLAGSIVIKRLLLLSPKSWPVAGLKSMPTTFSPAARLLIWTLLSMLEGEPLLKRTSLLERVSPYKVTAPAGTEVAAGCVACAGGV
jgi:hypothetical protein